VNTTAFGQIQALDHVGLEEMTVAADLQTRRDRKYLVAQSSLGDLIDLLGTGTRALEISGIRTFRYSSLYFDTVDLDCYLAAARGRPRRCKVRTRSYLDTERCVLEVKTRDRQGRTVKHRHPYALDDRDGLTDEGRRWVAEFDEVGPIGPHLIPMLTTSYRRTSLLLPDGRGRVTIDIDVACDQPDGNSVSLPDVAFVETKTAGPPCDVDRALWRSGSRPVAVSKYCAGLAALHPDLPANRWHRVLSRSFGLGSMTSPTRTPPATAPA
jgi:hypothetical protein